MLGEEWMMEPHMTSVVSWHSLRPEVPSLRETQALAIPSGWILPRPSAVQLFVGISVNLPKGSTKMAITDSLRGIVDGMQKWMFIQ